jgi:hypothetical protein
MGLLMVEPQRLLEIEYNSRLLPRMLSHGDFYRNVIIE